MTVEYGHKEDLESWMKLVEEVRFNFPGLETSEGIKEHKCIVLEFIKEQRALCIKERENIIGVLLYSTKLLFSLRAS